MTKLKNTIKPSSKLRKFSIGLLQIALLISVFLLASRYQERNMLHHDSQKAPVQRLVALEVSDQSSSTQTHQIGLSSNRKKQLLYFFAPWCTICRLSISNIEAQRNALLEKGFEVFYIGLEWEQLADLKTFAQEHQLSSPVLIGNSKTSQQYNIQGFPTYYLIDENGAVIHGSVGYSTELGVWLRSL